MHQDDLKEKDAFIIFFKIVLGKTASAARNWINSSPETDSTTFAFSSAFVLLLWYTPSVSLCLVFLILCLLSLQYWPPSIQMAGLLPQPPRQIFSTTKSRPAQCYYQSWERDSTAATKWQCFQATKLFAIAILLYLLWLLHQDTEIKIFFESFLVPEALLFCHVVAIKKMSRAQLWLLYLRVGCGQ